MSQKVITKNGLSIILDDEMIPRAKESAIERANDIDTGINTWYNVTGYEYINEVNRLCKIANSIMSSTSKIDIFDYLPLTKAGKFPKNQTILIADSDVKNTFNGEYFSQKTLQLRLVTGYASEEDFILDKTMTDVLLLEIDEFNSSSKTPPIFDKDNIPHKVIKERLTYLKDDEIIPGRIYEDAKGTKYLYIGCFNFYYALIQTKSKKEHILDSDDYGYPAHTYIRLTKNVINTAKGLTTVDEFIDKIIIDWSDEDHFWYEKLSMRENHRKFVKECEVLIPNSTITDHIVNTKTFKDDCFGSDCHWQYKIITTN